MVWPASHTRIHVGGGHDEVLEVVGGFVGGPLAQRPADEHAELAVARGGGAVVGRDKGLVPGARHAGLDVFLPAIKVVRCQVGGVACGAGAIGRARASRVVKDVAGQRGVAAGVGLDAFRQVVNQQHGLRAAGRGVDVHQRAGLYAEHADDGDGEDDQRDQ